MCQKRFDHRDFRVMKIEEIDQLKRKFDLIFSYTALEHIKAEDWETAKTAIKKSGKKLLLIEPMDFESVAYCQDHPYLKDFKVLKKKKLSDKWLILCDLS